MHLIRLQLQQCCISMVAKHAKVGMSTWLWHLDCSIGWRKFIRFWDQNHSASWRKCIRLWDLEHSAGWRKATRSIVREMSARNHRPGVAGLCQQRESENKHSTCPNKWDKSEEAWLSILWIAHLGKEVPANQALWIAVDVRDGVADMVVPELSGCCELPLWR